MANLNANPFVHYANTVIAQAKGNSRWLERCYQCDGIPAAAQAGAVTVPIITGGTGATPTDGTPLTNAAVRTLKTLTLVDWVFPVTLGEMELAQWTPDTMKGWVKACSSALINQTETALLTQIMAGTPMTSFTLTAGQPNFYDDGTDAEIRANMKVLTNALAYVMGITGQSDPSEYLIILPSVASPTTSTNSWANLWANAKTQSNLMYDGTLRAWTWSGTPIYGANSTATGWGKVDGGTAGIVCHRDSFAVGFPRARITPVRDNDSGRQQFEMKAAYATGLVNTGNTAGTWVEILNPAT